MNVPRRRTSTSEEHSIGNTSRAASAERSLLSQQIRLNSDNSLSQMSNGGAAHMGPGSQEGVEPQVGSSRQYFPPLPNGKHDSSHDRGNLMNGTAQMGADGALPNGNLLEGFGEQPSTESQSHRKISPSGDWHASASIGEQPHGQVSNLNLYRICCESVSNAKVSAAKDCLWDYGFP